MAAEFLGVFKKHWIFLSNRNMLIYERKQMFAYATKNLFLKYWEHWGKWVENWLSDDKSSKYASF